MSTSRSQLRRRGVQLRLPLRVARHEARLPVGVTFGAARAKRCNLRLGVCQGLVATRAGGGELGFLRREALLEIGDAGVAAAQRGCGDGGTGSQGGELGTRDGPGLVIVGLQRGDARAQIGKFLVFVAGGRNRGFQIGVGFLKAQLPVAAGLG